MTWLRVGYHYDVTEDGRYSQDGYVSAWVFFFALTSIPVATVTLFYTELQLDVVVRETHMVYTLAAVIACACAVMTYLMVTWRKWVVDEVSPPLAAGMKSRVSRLLLDHQAVVALAVFFTVGVIHDGAGLISNFRCLPAFISCPHHKQLYQRLIPEITLKVCRTLFFALQLGFCCRFHGKTLQRCTPARYGLMVVLSATTAAIFQVYLRSFRSQDMRHARKHHNHVHIPGTSETADYDCEDIHVPGNHSDQYCYYNCWTDQTTLMEFYFNTIKYFYPFHFEFALVAVRILIQLNSSMTRDHEYHYYRTETDVKDLLGDTGDTGETGYMEYTGGYQEGSGEMEPLLVQDGDRSRKHRGVPILVAVAGAVAIGATLVTLCLLTERDNHHPGSGGSFTYRTWFRVAMTTCSFLCTVIIVVSMRACRALPSLYTAPSRDQYSAMELLYLVAISGHHLVAALRVISGTLLLRGGALPTTYNTTHHHGNLLTPDGTDDLLTHHLLPLHPTVAITVTGIVCDVMAFICVSLQAVFVLHVTRVKVGRGLQVACVFLAVCNLTLWGVRGFAETSNPHLSAVTEYVFYGSSGDEGGSLWYFVVFLLNPLRLFHTITAAMLLTKPVLAPDKPPN